MGAVSTPEPQDGPREVLVDPAISRGKFDRELVAYRAIAPERRRRGWWILSAAFPDVVVAFVAPQLKPPAVVFGARINFDNYDLWAPSVRLVNPFTGSPIKAREVPPALAFTRRIGAQQVDIPGVGSVPGYTEQPLLQSHGPDELPFLCLPGVREYHEHPAHSGDSWLLHRGRGEGTLFFLLEILARYGLDPIRGYQMGVQVVGYQRAEAPE